MKKQQEYKLILPQEGTYRELTPEECENVVGGVIMPKEIEKENKGNE